MFDANIFSTLELFKMLDSEQRNYILKLMKRRKFNRGDSLVIEGEPSNALYIVLYGAFEVRPKGSSFPIAQIRAGEIIGEIGFFAGTPRSATVKAIRDSMVLEFNRKSYEKVVRHSHSIQEVMLMALARRLNTTISKLAPREKPFLARTIAVVQGGNNPIPDIFFKKLKNALDAAGAFTVDRETIEKRFGDLIPDRDDVRRWLNMLEWENSLLAYIADPGLTDWTCKCLRQADQVVIIVQGDAPGDSLNPVESLTCDLYPSTARRLVRLYDKRSSVVSGTSAWLSRINVHLHHHLSLEDDEDFLTLVRFFTGRAVGFVAGGGGAFGTAHLGIYKAFLECGIKFDIFIGTSVGAAISAGLAMRLAPDRINECINDIFVVSRSFKRPTLPKYALLDHKAFDASLARNYGAEVQIEDCWHPFLAVTTNLSRQQMELIKSGQVWKAVRSSAAIPGVLPPVFTDDGMMLVDGGLMDNAPLAPLKSFKEGPNLIVHFGRKEKQHFQCRYEDIPGRWEIISSLLNPFKRRHLPRAPGVASVLVRSIMAHQRYELSAETEDIVLQPPQFPGSSFINFDRHEEVYLASYEWAKDIVNNLQQSENPAFASMIAATANKSQTKSKI